MMHQVFLGIGSNNEKEVNIASCLELLRDVFDWVKFSPIYESQSVGIKAENFYNLVAHVTTSWSLEKCVSFIQATEQDYGRNRLPESKNIIPLDIDILLFDDYVGSFNHLQLPRPEILTNAFVLKPLADLAGDFIHPITNKSIQTLWSAYPAQKQKLWQVSLAAATCSA